MSGGKQEMTKNLPRKPKGQTSTRTTSWLMSTRLVGKGEEVQILLNFPDQIQIFHSKSVVSDKTKISFESFLCFKLYRQFIWSCVFALDIA